MKKLSERDLLVLEITKMIRKFPNQTSLTLVITKTIIRNMYTITVTDGTHQFMQDIALESVPFKSYTTKYLMKELGFKNCEKSKYGQEKVIFT